MRLQTHRFIFFIFYFYLGTSLIDYVFENRLKSEIAKSFRNALNKSDEEILPLSEDEKRGVKRFLRAFLKHMNVSLENINETTSENLLSDLKKITKSLNQNQVENFLVLPKIDVSEEISANTSMINITNNDTNQSNYSNETHETVRKSEIEELPEIESNDINIFDTVVDDLTNYRDGISQPESTKRKEISPTPSKILDITDNLEENLGNSFQKFKESQNDSSKRKISEELFNILSKEGWQEYTKLTQKESIIDKSSKITNYIHWDFLNIEGHKIIGSPGNPLAGNGNLLFNNGSVTFLENSFGFLNGGEYKDLCISDPSKCIDGFSIQITFKITNKPPNTNDNQYFLIDTGASSPDSRGFSIFLMPNETLGVHVADGTHNWCAVKSLSNKLIDKWVSLIVIFNKTEGISMISGCKEMTLAISYGRCTPCINCHLRDTKTNLVIGRANNINDDYPTLPMILSDLELYFYPLNQSQIFDKCGIVGDTNTKKDKIDITYPSAYSFFSRNIPQSISTEFTYSLVNPYITPDANYYYGTRRNPYNNYAYYFEEPTIYQNKYIK